VIVGAHIPVGILSEENEPCIARSSVTEVSEARLLSRLHEYTNQVLRLAARQPFNHAPPCRPDPSNDANLATPNPGRPRPVETARRPGFRLGPAFSRTPTVSECR